MKVKNIIVEDFSNYKKSSLFIGTAFCDWKCCKECGENICQNLPLAESPTIDIAYSDLVSMYTNNYITSAIVFGGLEPMDQFDELLAAIGAFRRVTDDDIVIYTGYNKEEIIGKIRILTQYPHIIVKFGRYVPNQKPHFDNILGVNLVSDNQYAEVIS